MSASESVTPRLYAEALASAHLERQAATTQRFRSVLACVEAAADFVSCAAGMFAACLLDVSLHGRRQAIYSIREAAAVSVVVGLCAVLLLERSGAYRGGGSLLQIRETERALRVSALSVLALLAFGFLLDRNVSVASALIALILMPVLLILQKLTFVSIVRMLHGMGYGIDRAVVYGAGGAGKRIVSALFHSVRLGVQPVAVIDDNPALSGSRILEMGYARRRSVLVRRGPVTPELLSSFGCSLLIVAPQNLSSERQTAATDAAKRAGVKVAFLGGVELEEHEAAQPVHIDGFWLAPKSERPAPWHYAFLKRMVDQIVSAALLLALSPLLLLIAILIKIDSPGPALFIQKRVGRNGELFNIFKFRSMIADAPKYDFSPTTSRDPRITRIGRFLRQTSLDELPQLINVFMGNMSLVGPRPEMPFIVEEYTSVHRQRLQVSPGITGLWQLSADRAFLIHENIQYDLYYIRNRGFFLDLAILIHTLFFAVRRVA